MAGPAMIEGGDSAVFTPMKSDPLIHCATGAIDLLAEDEAHATALAKWALSYGQGTVQPGLC